MKPGSTTLTGPRFPRLAGPDASRYRGEQFHAAGAGRPRSTRRGRGRRAPTTLAARSDLPVELVVDLPERPSAAIETIAYFCAAELLANVAKHSGARHATLEVVRAAGLLRVRVSDDGTGGARLEERGGLAGLAERIRTVDGRLQLSSPPGGPTVVTVELPSHA
jgi:signal transduction histidine kinase